MNFDQNQRYSNIFSHSRKPNFNNNRGRPDEFRPQQQQRNFDQDRGSPKRSDKGYDGFDDRQGNQGFQNRSYDRGGGQFRNDSFQRYTRDQSYQDRNFQD